MKTKIASEVTSLVFYNIPDLSKSGKGTFHSHKNHGDSGQWFLFSAGAWVQPQREVQDDSV